MIFGLSFLEISIDFCASQVGEIISRFEKKGFTLKGNQFAIDLFKTL
jgi:hypothetical protein